MDLVQVIERTAAAKREQVYPKHQQGQMEQSAVEKEKQSEAGSEGCQYEQQQPCVRPALRRRSGKYRAAQLRPYEYQSSHGGRQNRKKRVHLEAEQRGRNDRDGESSPALQRSPAEGQGSIGHYRDNYGVKAAEHRDDDR